MNKENPQTSGVQQRAKELIVNMAGAVQSQLKAAVSAFTDQDEKQARKVIEKDDYIDNLYSYTESELFLLLEKKPNQDQTRIIRTALKTAKGLEKIADYAENIAKQSLHILDIEDESLSIDILRCYRHAKEGIDLAVQAFLKRDMDIVKRLAKKEAILDEVYRKQLGEALELLRTPGQNVQFLLTQVFVAKYLEKLGDTLLDMAEETLMIISGERVKLHQFIHLNRLAQNEKEVVNLEGLWGTRSGSTIFKFESNGHESFIYKDGNIRKIKAEVQKLKEWNEIEPGLVPEVTSNLKFKNRQMITTSFFEGLTLQEIYTKFWWSEKEMVTEQLTNLLQRIWTQTYAEEILPYGAIAQIRSRLDAVYSMHEQLEQLRSKPIIFCGLRQEPLEELLQGIENHSERLQSPFSVHIHGDFNTDNILYNAEKERLQLIDVYRSAKGDYLQDISVFMVSNIRIPKISGLQRQEAEHVNQIVETFARRFAEAHGDKFFEERLAILLARSLITSTRFVGSFKKAQKMFLAGIDKLEWALERLED